MSLSTTMKIMANSLFAFNLLFVLAGVVRGFYARGTRRRYILATAQWTVLPPAVAYSVIAVMGGTMSGSKASLISGVINFATIVWVFYDLYKDDDDNWWKRKRKQPKRYLRSIRLRTPQLAASRT